MTAVLSWVLNIVIRAALITVLFLAIRGIIRNGGATIRLIFETIGTVVKYGCLNLRFKLNQRLHDKCSEKEEEKPIEEVPGPGVKVEGTVV
jgi:hypothetical protein